MSETRDLLQLAADLAARFDALGIDLGSATDRYQVPGDWSEVDCDTDEMEIIITLRGNAAQLIVNALTIPARWAQDKARS